MIKAIIFDCFGVLTNDGWKALREEYCTTKELQDAAHDLDVAVNSGFMNNAEFVSRVASLFGLNREEVEHKFGTRHTNTTLFSFIESTLKPKYKIGLLSNAAYNMLDELFLPDQVALFDAVTLSCDLGIVKPDERIYADIAAKLNVTAEECLFTDDIERYCTAARDTGMEAITYDSFSQFERDLQKLLQ